MRTVAGETPGWKTRVVLLDGQKLNHCYLADEELGYVEVWQTDERGMRRINVPRLKRHGTVRVLDEAEWEREQQ